MVSARTVAGQRRYLQPRSLALAVGLGLAVGGVAACGFKGAGQPDDAGRIDAPSDGSGGGSDGQTGPRSIPHLPPDHQQAGTADLTFVAGTIDTTALTLPGGAESTPGITFELVAQQGSGPQLAVLHARSVTLPAALVVTATGQNPLVIVAQTITIAGTLDGGAQGAVPGPGGGSSGNGPDRTAGGSGSDDGAGGSADAGGGGGAFGSAGGNGGNLDTSVACPQDETSGPGGGMATDNASLDILEGGGGGGPGSPGDCTVAVGGGGGGAIQLSAIGTLQVMSGAIIGAGGGGGTGGLSCETSNSGAGGGGGAGGAIYLDGAMVVQNGTVLASGGGGGGGACTANGGSGEDAGLQAKAASGGVGKIACGLNGGAGGFGAAPAGNGANDQCAGNSGAGGGSVGRIVYHANAASDVTGTGSGSPSPTIEPPP